MLGVNGEIIFSGFSKPDVAGDDSDKAFSFSLNSDGSGFVNCNRIQDVNVSLTDIVYNGSLNTVSTTLSLNSNARIDRLNVAQITRNIDGANLLQNLCQ